MRSLGSRPVVILVAVAGGMLLATAMMFLWAPIHVRGADCGTLFTASDNWVSLSAGGPESDDVQEICHDGHTRRLIWVVTLTISGVAALSWPVLNSADPSTDQRHTA